jgi:HK97 family phage prohead protease
MTEKIFKAFSVISKAVDLEAGIFEAMISTEAVDRQGDIVRATGAKLDNYLKNPVVLWAHDYGDTPVAKCLSIEIMPGKGLKATFQFPEWGTSARADEVRRLWAAGFLNATSIGFIPITSMAIDPNDKYGWGPQDYVEWELLEFSIVPVPANQEALRLAVKSLETELNKHQHQGGYVRPGTSFLIGSLKDDSLEIFIPTVKGSIQSKSGRVLSASNESKIRKAQVLLTDVLSQLQEEEPVEEDITGSEPVIKTGKAEPTVTDDIEQRSEATAEFNQLFTALKEKYKNGRQK